MENVRMGPSGVSRLISKACCTAQGDCFDVRSCSNFRRSIYVSQDGPFMNVIAVMNDQ